MALIDMLLELWGLKWVEVAHIIVPSLLLALAITTFFDCGPTRSILEYIKSAPFSPFAWFETLFTWFENLITWYENLFAWFENLLQGDAAQDPARGTSYEFKLEELSRSTERLRQRQAYKIEQLEHYVDQSDLQVKRLSESLILKYKLLHAQKTKLDMQKAGLEKQKAGFEKQQQRVREQDDQIAAYNKYFQWAEQGLWEKQQTIDQQRAKMSDQQSLLVLQGNTTTSEKAGFALHADAFTKQSISIRELQKEAEQKDALIETLNNKVATLEAEAEQQADATTTADSNDASSRHVEDVATDELTRAEEELNRTQRDLDLAKETLSRYQDDMAVLTADNEKLREHLDTQQGLYDVWYSVNTKKINDFIASGEKDLADAVHARDDAVAKFDAKAQTEREMHALLYKRDTVIEHLELQADELVTVLGTLKGRHNAAIDEHNDLIDTYNALLLERDDLQERNETLTSDLNASIIAKEEVASKLKDSKAANEDVNATLFAHISSLSRATKDLTFTRASLASVQKDLALLREVHEKTKLRLANRAALLEQATERSQRAAVASEDQEKHLRDARQQLESAALRDGEQSEEIERLAAQVKHLQSAGAKRARAAKVMARQLEKARRERDACGGEFVEVYSDEEGDSEVLLEVDDGKDALTAAEVEAEGQQAAVIAAQEQAEEDFCLLSNEEVSTPTEEFSEVSMEEVEEGDRGVEKVDWMRLALTSQYCPSGGC